MKNDNLSGQKPRIAVCGVESHGAEILEVVIEKMRASDEFDDEFDFDRIKFISINADAFILIYSQADIKIYLDKCALCGGRPFSHYLADYQIEETKSILRTFDYVIILARLGTWDGITAFDTIKFANEVNSNPYVISAYPFWFEGNPMIKQINEILAELDSMGIPYWLLKPGATFGKIELKNIPIKELFNEEDNLMANKAIEIVRQIIETGKIEQ